MINPQIENLQISMCACPLIANPQFFHHRTLKDTEEETPLLKSLAPLRPFHGKNTNGGNRFSCRLSV